MVVFGMHNPLPGRHHLHFARGNHALIAKIILMLELPLQNIGDDLHIAMRMRA